MSGNRKVEKRLMGTRLVKNMPALENSRIIEHLLKILIKIIGRRTSKNIAVTTVGNTIKELKPKYDFLKYVYIEDALYSEKKDDVIIESEINAVETGELGKAIDEIFDTIIKSLGKNVGYFYIKEIQDDLEKEIGSFFNEFEINLNIKQQEHLLNIMESSVIKIQDIKNSEVFEIVLSALVRLLNRRISESFTKETIMDSIKELEEQYGFLRHICIVEKRDPQSPYEVNIDPEIDNILIAERGEVIQRLIGEIGKSSDLKTRRFLGEKFEMLLGTRDLSKIKRVGIKLDDIDKALRKEGHQLLVTEIFQAIISIIEAKNSTSFAVKYIESLVEKMQDKHDVLKYVKVDKSRYDAGIDAIEIMPEINSVDSELLGRAIRNILGQAQTDLKKITYTFIKDFEKSIDKEYLSELGKIGVNMHLLELRSL